MSDDVTDIYTEPADVDPHTLAHLGPLAALAGRFQGTRGMDVNPQADGPRRQAYLETIELVPIDPQTNGPQLLYGLRYHQHVLKPDAPETYHDQVGYWLWEPATGAIYQTLSIPRAQTLLASGRSSPGARRFEVRAERGSTSNGIASNPFLEAAFRTIEYRLAITLHDDGSWTYESDTLLLLHGRGEPFHHTDRNTLVRVAPPAPNPLALL